MKLRTFGAVLAATGLSLSLAACNDNGSDSEDNSSSATSTTSSAAAAMPTAAELNTVLATAVDPAAPMDQRVTTVQGGETVDPALFDTLSTSQVESGAQFQVVDPVLPGYTPDSVLTTVNFTLPDREPQVAENVEFVNENGTWKLSQSWACTLVTNTVAPEQVPAMCQDPNAAPAPAAEAPAADAPAPEAPVEEAPAPEAPVEASAPEAPVEEAPVQ